MVLVPKKREAPIVLSSQDVPGDKGGIANVGWILVDSAYRRLELQSALALLEDPCERGGQRLHGG
jgi:hypothetical protein